MVDSIGGRSAPLAREAILAAMKAQARSADKIQERAAAATSQAASLGSTSGAGGVAGSSAPSFADAIKDGIAEVNAEVQRAESLPADLVKGDVNSLTEVAGRLKTADLTFRFSMEIRNKLLDAYREVMRMQV